MNELHIFKNPDFGQVRVVNINGEPWLVGKDVAEALGYSNSRKALIDHVDDDDKGVTKCDTLGGVQNMTIINESGVYALVFSSKLPKAKEFKRWVTSEVLPSIRKHGAYMTKPTIEQIITSPDFLIKLATELKNEKEARQEAEAKVKEQAPKVLFADTVSGSQTSILVGQLAKLVKQRGVNIGRNRLFQWLRRNGYIEKHKNEPTQKSMNLKVMEVKERTVNNPDGSIRITRTPMITGNGQIYFVDKLVGGVAEVNKEG